MAGSMGGRLTGSLGIELLIFRTKFFFEECRFTIVNRCFSLNLFTILLVIFFQAVLFTAKN